MKRDLLIMVVDDQAEMREMMQRVLELEGFSVEVANDGKLALELFTRVKPDLILLDMIMPGLDGLEVLERLREISDVPVIMLTAKAELENKARTLNGGADDYITKPFMTRELIARVRTKLRRNGTLVPRPSKSSALRKMLGSNECGKPVDKLEKRRLL